MIAAAPRCPRILVAIVLLPILEPVALTVALGEGSPTLGTIAAAWLSLATAIRWAASGIAAFSLFFAVRHLAGHIHLPHPRRWGTLTVGGFFSLVSVAALYPAGAHQAAQLRADKAADEIASAIRQYRRTQGRLPANLNALVPLYLPTSPTPRIAGSTIQYQVESTGYTLTIPALDRSTPFIHQRGTGTHLGDALEKWSNQYQEAASPPPRQRAGIKDQRSKRPALMRRGRGWRSGTPNQKRQSKPRPRPTPSLAFPLRTFANP